VEPGEAGHEIFALVARIKTRTESKGRGRNRRIPGTEMGERISNTTESGQRGQVHQKRGKKAQSATNLGTIRGNQESP